jgi:muconate cycloisomerase
VLDACCRSLGVPLSDVTTAVPETIAVRERSARVRYSAAFTAMTPWKQTTRALLLKLFGFRQAKVKVGMPDVDDAATLRRIRGIVGSRMDLRIDANEAWTCENLSEKLSPLVPFGITAVEQPVPHETVSGLSRVRPSLGVPIMLDESLCGDVDARRAIERGTCDLFNIRLSKCGGFVPSLRLAALAHQAGLGYQLGCQVGETGILSAAGRHFAASVAGLRYLEGSYDRFLVAERLTKEDLTFGYGGLAPALPGPGLGIAIDPAALARVTVAEQRFMGS